MASWTIEQVQLTLTCQVKKADGSKDELTRQFTVDLEPTEAGKIGDLSADALLGLVNTGTEKEPSYQLYRAKDADPVAFEFDDETSSMTCLKGKLELEARLKKGTKSKTLKFNYPIEAEDNKLRPTFPVSLRWKYLLIPDGSNNNTYRLASRKLGGGGGIPGCDGCDAPATTGQYKECLLRGCYN